MIQLIGIKGYCDIDIRQKFSIVSSKLDERLKSIFQNIGTVVIVSTCNRTEIYLDTNFEKEILLEKVFKEMCWDRELISYIFYVKDKEAVKHLMEVSCGFHSKIIGEDQILGQIKTGYEAALKNKTAGGSLQRLFQNAITCSKKFKDSCEIYKIPVSSASIVSREIAKREIRNIMLIGYGDTGSLVLKYLSSGKFDNLYIVVRDIKKYEKVPLLSGVKFISFSEKTKYLSLVDAVISCTSAPHTVLNKEEIPEKNMLIFDMAVPRDVHKDIYTMKNIEIYNIDDISSIDEENKAMRIEQMKKYKWIIEEAIEKFMQWVYLRDLSPKIQEIKSFGNKVSLDRIKTFKNKRESKDIDALAEKLLKSISNVYINNAIEVLKEAKLEGREEECLKILEKIFC